MARLVWDHAALQEFLRDPRGEVGRKLMVFIGEEVVNAAKADALRRTGRMADAIDYEVGEDEGGLYVDIRSPVQDPRTGFQYAQVHEGRRVRDRRPHRSLVPAVNKLPPIIR